VLFEHIGKSGRALEAGIPSDLLDGHGAMPHRVDRVSEAPLDQITVGRPLRRSVKAADEIIFGNADELCEIGQCYVAADIGLNWVEKGIAPSQVIGQSAGPAATPLSRPLCPYRQTAQYGGTGDIHDAANWVCGGSLETPQVVCPDVLVRFKHEVDGGLDFRGSGVRPEDCHERDQKEERDHDDDDDNSDHG
jgi:hypothetical protein